MRITSMRMRLSLVIIGVSLITSTVIGGLYAYTAMEDNEHYLAEYRQDLLRDADVKISTVTQTVMGIVNEFYAMQQAGILTEEQAMTQAASVVRNIRYDEGEGYFWIDTDTGVNVVLLGGETEGKSRLDSADIKGRRYVREMIEKGMAGGGYTDVMFPKPGSDEPLPKRNYTAYFAPYHWVVGTGIWIDSIDKLVDNWAEELSAQLRFNILRMVAGLILLQFFFAALAFYVSNNLSRPIKALTGCLQVMGDTSKLEDEEILTELHSLAERDDEIGKMHRALKDMHLKMVDYQHTILEMAHNDALTGLANRRYFQEFVRDAGPSKGFVVIAMDLDHFKEVNDKYGHQTGDAALLIFAEVLKSVFTDALNVRTGGDEFISLMTHQTSMEAVEEKLSRFMAQLISIYQSDIQLSKLTVSAGVAASFDEELPIDILLQHGDVALYAAKTAGRSCYIVYEPEK
ncbi:MAG: cache domain-containing protein [Selenomonadaceae bacterium]|nr:cache domain-containing protein [Selenomonadaceae bacterium]